MSDAAPRDSVDGAMQQWQTLRPDLDVTPIAVLARISKIQSRAQAQQEAALDGTDLTAPDFAAVIALRRRPPPYRATASDLARALGVTQGTVTTRVDRLVAGGLATRTRDTADARVQWVQLSDLGAAVFDEVVPAHLAAQRAVLAPLHPEQRRQLADLLRTWLAALEASG